MSQQQASPKQVTRSTPQGNIEETKESRIGYFWRNLISSVFVGEQALSKRELEERLEIQYAELSRVSAAFLRRCETASNSFKQKKLVLQKQLSEWKQNLVTT